MVRAGLHQGDDRVFDEEVRRVSNVISRGQQRYKYSVGELVKCLLRWGTNLREMGILYYADLEQALGIWLGLWLEILGGETSCFKSSIEIPLYPPNHDPH